MEAPKNLVPLLDADILAYEIAAAGEFYPEDEDGNKGEEKVILPFSHIEPYFADRVAEFKRVLNTQFEPIMYLSGDTNFRDIVAKRKGYKANRDESKKPFHLANARAFIRSRFNTFISVGCEADDLLACSQIKDLKKPEVNFDPEKATTVIVTRDKDLRQCMGWHYGWESGNQPEFKLQWVDELGTLKAIYKEGVTKTGRPSKRFYKLTGTGLKWLYAQCLLGDPTDNIPGLPKCGGAAAFKILNPCESETELLDATIKLYQERYAEDEWEREFFEQMNLVYIIQEMNDDNSLKWWTYPEGYTPPAYNNAD
jgi:hypothetical protein